MSAGIGWLDTLARELGERHVIRETTAMTPWLIDQRRRYHGTALAVVFPADTREVVRVVRACAAAGVAIVPQGGNTGLCGAATPFAEHPAVLVNLSRLDRIRAVDAENATLTAEAGCTLAAVQEAASAAGRLFPVALASQGSCQVGGIISTNAGGVQVLRYGTTRDQVLGLEVVLADGRVWHGLRGLRKDNTGYDLKQLFVGAEGTLGLITAATLRLQAATPARATAWVSVRDPHRAVALLHHMQAMCGAALTAFELVSDVALALVLRHFPAAQAPLPTASATGWAVLVELSGARTAELEPQLQTALTDALAQSLAVDAVIAQSDVQAARLWALRENVSEAQKRHGYSIKHDIAVPVSRIADFLAAAEQRLLARWPELRVVAFGHVGDGNLHYNLSLHDDADNDAFVLGDAAAAVNAVVYDLVAELGGSISAEHGLGVLKRDTIRRYRTPLELELQARIKQALDPHGRMNPGKLL